MGGGGSGEALRDLRTLLTLGRVGDQTDRQLIEQFLARDGDIAEAAFSTLVDRHGPMVLGVCRRILSDPHDIQDAFQATFLVLVKKAGSIRVDDSLGRWLYGVSVRIARRSRAVGGRRKSREEPVSGELPAAPSRDEERYDDLKAILDEELLRLPATYRAALVLCYLEGYTHEQAARQLGWPVGTVRSRLARGRERMRLRLLRRGLAPSAGLFGAMLAAEVNSATVPAGLVEVTVRVAMRTAEGKAAMAGAVPAAVAALSETVIRTTLMIKLRMAASALLTLGVMAVGAGGLARQHPEAGKQPEAQQSEGEGLVGTTGPARSDTKSILGTWRAVSVQRGGRKAPEDEDKGLKLVITSDTLTVEGEDKEQVTSPYKLDPSKDPKWIDATEKGGRPAPGIYDLQGDDLKLCYNESGDGRPTRFASEPNSPNDVLLILRRVRPKAAVKAPDHPEAQLRREIRGAARSVSSVPYDGTARNGSQLRIHTLLVLAKTQAKMGDMDAARETLVRAVQVAETIKLQGGRMDDHRPERLLAMIALVQAEVGLREDARETLRKVIDATKHLRNDQGKLSTLEIIVSVHMALGDWDDARGTLPMMREIAQKTEDSYYLISATARTGNYHGATAIAIESSRLKHATPENLDNRLMEIAWVAADSGNVKEALRVSEAIADVKTKELALRRIAMIQVVAGDVEGTRAWIDRLDSPRLKARALDGLAMGLAARAGVGWEAMGTISELSR